MSNWKAFKQLLGVVAALLLLSVSAVAFTTGLSFNGEWGAYIGFSVWVSLTIIQLIGNDSENHDDGLFTAGWLFTYVLGIGAGAWAFYSWVNIPNEIIRWCVSIGIGGATEILPEKLIVIFFKSGAFSTLLGLGSPKPKNPPKESFTAKPAPNTPTPVQRPKPEYKPIHRPTWETKPADKITHRTDPKYSGPSYSTLSGDID